MSTSRRIFVTEETQVGEARRCANDLCHRLGANETFCGKAAIVVTEMAHNLVRHGGGGELLIREIPSLKHSSLEFIALDQGRGMRNVTECLRDGYSTSGTAGTGLGSIKRLADRFELYTAPDRGTVVWARLCTAPQENTSEQFEVGAASVALENEEVCGDAWEVIESPGSLRLMVTDGLGHGPFAEDAARNAIAVFRSHPQAAMEEVLELTHRALVKTRGAAAAVVELRPNRQVTNVGVGNISARLITPGKSKNLVSDNGTLGANVRKFQSYTQPWSDDMLLVVHSDGISQPWNLDDYPGLAHRHPSVIAGVLYRDFKRRRDDATVVVVRYVPRS